MRSKSQKFSGSFSGSIGLISGVAFPNLGKNSEDGSTNIQLAHLMVIVGLSGLLGSLARSRYQTPLFDGCFLAGRGRRYLSRTAYVRVK